MKKVNPGKISLQIINKGGLRDFEVKTPEGKSYTFENPVAVLIGSMFSCETHMMKMWSRKLRIDIKEIRVKNVEGTLNMAGVMNKENEKSMLNSLSGDIEVVTDAP